MQITDYEPKSLWKHFDQIRQIPRCSGNEEQARQYVLSFAKERGYGADTDASGNVDVVYVADTNNNRIQKFSAADGTFLGTWGWGVGGGAGFEVCPSGCQAGIAGGGGGIPVTRIADGDLVGVEAVIDKDLTAGLLAREIGSELLLIATGVERVALKFGKPTQRWLERLSVAEAKQYMSEGQFAAGSMLPKIEASVEFLEGSAPSARVLICELNRMTEALAGATGTWIVPDAPG